MVPQEPRRPRNEPIASSRAIVLDMVLQAPIIHHHSLEGGDEGRICIGVPVLNLVSHLLQIPMEMMTDTCRSERNVYGRLESRGWVENCGSKLSTAKPGSRVIDETILGAKGN